MLLVPRSLTIYGCEMLPQASQEFGQDAFRIDRPKSRQHIAEGAHQHNRDGLHAAGSCHTRNRRTTLAHTPQLQRQQHPSNMVLNDEQKLGLYVALPIYFA
eukprot:5436321-Pleurochrysis_carterae.AAC.1